MKVEDITLTNEVNKIKLNSDGLEKRKKKKRKRSSVITKDLGITIRLYHAYIVMGKMSLVVENKTSLWFS